MGIAANKMPGIRAAVVWNETSARLSRAHNDANIMAIGGRTPPAGDVGPVDPRVAGADPLFAAAADHDFRFRGGCHSGLPRQHAPRRRARRPSIMRNPAGEIE
jgi:hypothetical protein